MADRRDWEKETMHLVSSANANHQVQFKVHAHLGSYYPAIDVYTDKGCVFGVETWKEAYLIILAMMVYRGMHADT